MCLAFCFVGDCERALCFIRSPCCSLLSFCRSIRIYSPVHALPLILFRGKDIARAPLTTLTRYGKAVFRSSLFLTSYVTAVK